MTDIVKPSILPGFMELLPEDQVLFNGMKDIIEEKFKKYGFLPIDTPIIEKSEILNAKAGGETEKQIYKIESETKDMSLRFDLTVPLARYVAMHMNDLSFPFRRYQIGKVYRGERNQRGRFREFYQCDIDIIGQENLSFYNDAEIPAVIYEIFKDMNFTGLRFHMNNRKLINGLLESLGVEDSPEVLRIIDKIKKIGEDQVLKELGDLGLSYATVEKLIEFISKEGKNEEIISFLNSLGVESDLYDEGLEEMEFVYKYMKSFGIPEENIVLDLSITRGLDYYTSTVYETFLEGYEDIGSVCSGGRYENLAGFYTKKSLPGIGLSIGLTRLFYQFKEAGLLNFENEPPIKYLVVPMKGTEDYAIRITDELRKKGLKVQIYLEGGKMKRVFSYADKLKAPYVIIAGQDEMEKEVFSLRDMDSGEQREVSLSDLTSLN